MLAMLQVILAEFFTRRRHRAALNLQGSIFQSDHGPFFIRICEVLLKRDYYKAQESGLPTCQKILGHSSLKTAAGGNY